MSADSPVPFHTPRGSRMYEQEPWCIGLDFVPGSASSPPRISASLSAFPKGGVYQALLALNLLIAGCDICKQVWEVGNTTFIGAK